MTAKLMRDRREISSTIPEPLDRFRYIGRIKVIQQICLGFTPLLAYKAPTVIHGMTATPA